MLSLDQIARIARARAARARRRPRLLRCSNELNGILAMVDRMRGGRYRRASSPCRIRRQAMQRLREDAVTETDQRERLPGRRARDRGRPLPRAESDRVAMHDSTLAELSGAAAAKKVSSGRGRALLPRPHRERTTRAQRVHHRRRGEDASRRRTPPTRASRRARRRRSPASRSRTRTSSARDGWRTTCGSKMLENFVAPYDAHVIEQFDRAGAVILGKTNMDEFAMGSSNENSHFGPVQESVGRSARCPAAARAARRRRSRRGLRPRATGTDTGGSIRQPASFTGVSGLRPTYGRVSRYGMVAFASSLDQGGALAQTAEDLALMLDVMAGFDARDSTCVDRPTDDYARGLAGGVKGLRIGVPREYFGKDLAPDVRDADPRGDRGAARSSARQLVEVSLPNQHLSVPAYYVLAPAEASSNLSRYDGVRYGHRARATRTSRDMYRKTRARGLRRRGEAPHPDRHLRALARLLRRLLPAGAEDPPPHRARLHRGVQAVRRDHRARRAVGRVRPRREGQGPGADVPRRPLHDPDQPRGPAGACRSRAASAHKGRPVGLQIDRQLLRSEARMLARRARLSSRRPTGTRARAAQELHGGDEPGKSSSGSRRTRSSRRRRRSSRARRPRSARRRTRRPPRSISRCPARCRC